MDPFVKTIVIESGLIALGFLAVGAVVALRHLIGALPRQL